MSYKGVSEAYYLAVQNMAAVHGAPLPKGLLTANVEGWDLTLNATDESIDDLPPYNLRAAHDTYLAFAIFGPDGGVIGGAPEDDFIRDMNKPGIERSAAKGD